MMTKIDVPTPGKRAIPDTGQQRSSSLQVKRRSHLKLVLAWAVVVLPLAWGLYKTGQIVAPLVRALLSHSY
jgi:hypothetical protein